MKIMNEIVEIAGCVGWQYGAVRPGLHYTTSLYFHRERRDRQAQPVYNIWKNEDPVQPSVRHSFDRVRCLMSLRIIFRIENNVSFYQITHI